VHPSGPPIYGLAAGDGWAGRAGPASCTNLGVNDPTGAPPNRRPGRPLISNHQEIVVEGALQGLGILYAYDDERIDDLIARGQLKRVLAEWSVTLPGLFLYYSNRRLPQPALRAFIDCLLDRETS
jgi:DNA-binding transcriptional LysR family regulator